jgi:hypothetical protein
MLNKPMQRTSKIPLLIGADEPVGFLGIDEDITERKLAKHPAES